MVAVWVFACVSCSLIAPKPNRPTRGIFIVNLELSPMASSDYEGGRPESWIEMQRLLERSLKESQCVDVESLCVIGGEKVWQIRCDLHVLDNDGSVLDCASFAALAALRHFRRPFVSVKGLSYTIHDAKERSLVPITVYNSPFCVSLGITKNEDRLIVNDLTGREEMAISDIIIIAMNNYRETVLQHTCKNTLLHESELFRCQGRVISRVANLTDLLNEALQQDARRRTANMDISFNDLIQRDISYSSTDEQIFQTTFIKKRDVRRPVMNKAKDYANVAKVTIVKANSKKSATTISDVEIVEELMMTETVKTTVVAEEVGSEEKAKNRQMLPEDVAMMLDEIEEDVQVMDDPSLL